MTQSPERRVAIVQSCYVPWKGYFDIIGSVDLFIIYDDVQYAKAHWHNRNQILTASGPKWMTIPVLTRGDRFQAIKDVQVSQPFVDKHWRSLEYNYSGAPYWESNRGWVYDLYARAREMEGLSEINVMFMRAISEWLGFSTKFVFSDELGEYGGRTERLVKLCQAVGATSYLSGPTAAAYIEPERFDDAGIALEWMNYDGYPPYPQQFPPFAHAVTILDLIFNVGPTARSYMKAPVYGANTAGTPR